MSNSARFPRLLGLLALAFVPLASNPAHSVASCRADETALSEDLYPDHALSPIESLKVHDAVFLAEVAVPVRRCSLGYCAGLRVVQRVKGDPGPTTLVQIARDVESACMPAIFAKQGRRWLVFAQGGTSRRGHRYFQVAENGPSYVTSTLPDFRVLEGRYHQLRARLDEAIDHRMGRLR